MADSTNTTYTNVADLPDYLKPYMKLALNAITGMTFTPQYLAAQGMGSLSATDWTSAGAANGPAPQPQPQPDPASVMAQYRSAPVPSRTGIASLLPADYGMTPVEGGNTQRGMLDMQSLLGDPIFARHMADGGIVVDPMRLSLIGGDATLSGVGAPVTVGGGGSTFPITSAGQSGNVVTIGQNNYPQGGGIASLPYTPGGLPGGVSGGGTGGVTAAGGTLPGGLSIPRITSTLGESLGIQRAGTYANPDVSPDRAMQIARMIGGRGIGEVAPTQGPFDYTPQSLVDMGNELYMNTNLMERRMKDPNAAAQLHDEVAAHDAAKAMGPVDYAASLQQGYKGGERFAKGGLASLQRALKQKRYATGGWAAGADPGTGGTPSNPSTPNWGAGAQTFGAGVFQPYQPYGGQRLLNSDPSKAGPNTWSISNRTQAAESGLSSLPGYFAQDGSQRIDNPELGHARDLMSYAGDKAGDLYSGISNLINGYDPANTSIRSQYQQQSYTPSTFTASGVDPNSLQMGSSGTIQMSPLNMFQVQNPQMFDSGIAAGYMSPYQRAVTDVQKQMAMRDFNETKSTRDAQAVRAGAFGGSRQGVVDSLANRDLQNTLAEIEATGNQSAFANAQQQFERDRAAQMGADTTNLGSALQTQGLKAQTQLGAAQSNQNARLNEFGTLFGGQLQARLANQNAELQRQQLEEASRQFGANFGDQSSRFADTQQLSAEELRNRLQQSAIGLGQNAVTQMNQVGGNYADLSRLAQQLEIQRLQQLQGAGQTEDARRQAGLDVGYQDFINQQNYPFQLANFYSGILRGVPTAFNQEGVQLSQANYSPLSQGLGTAAGIAGLLGQLGIGKRGT